MNMSYATITLFNHTRRLYRESHMKYMVSNIDRPNNNPVYSIHLDLDSFIFFNEDEITKQENENEKELSPLEHSNLPSNKKRRILNFSSLEQQNKDEYEIETLWNMSFDGSCAKSGLVYGYIIQTKDIHTNLISNALITLQNMKLSFLA